MKVRHLKRFVIPTSSRRRSTSWILKDMRYLYRSSNTIARWNKVKRAKLPRIVLKAIHYRNYWK